MGIRDFLLAPPVTRWKPRTHIGCRAEDLAIAKSKTERCRPAIQSLMNGGWRFDDDPRERHWPFKPQPLCSEVARSLELEHAVALVRGHLDDRFGARLAAGLECATDRLREVLER